MARIILNTKEILPYTTLTPTNRYGFCRIPDGNGPLGSIAIIGTPFSVY